MIEFCTCVRLGRLRACFANVVAAALMLLMVAGSVQADEKLAGIACRSVHLGYPAEESVAFYNEVTVEKSAPGTYFMVAGFNAGYFGIQELANGKKLVLFSVWDPGEQNDPNAVKTEDRVRLEYNDPQVRVKRFGGEGTGGQSFFDFDWKVGTTYRCLVTSTAKDGRSVFTGYFYLPEEKQWRKLVTFSTIATKRQLRGLYSFVEDFKRDRVSATKERQARFGNGWVKTLTGEWKPLATATFTADSNPATNIDAGPIEDRFFLATGGETPANASKLRQKMQAKSEDAKLPPDLEELLKPAP